MRATFASGLLGLDAQRGRQPGQYQLLSPQGGIGQYLQANGDSMIIRPEHLGIVNGLATVGITHDLVGGIDGFWGQPLVSSSFHVLPRLWGRTDQYGTLTLGCRFRPDVRDI